MLVKPSWIVRIGRHPSSRSILRVSTPQTLVSQARFGIDSHAGAIAIPSTWRASSAGPDPAATVARGWTFVAERARRAAG
ncbi:MAG TPA: hypothetical protein VL049_24115 [Candidatus Dormibacteraeota bacterium]|nr:hypothetical protein [Candidatus Dormibacteraeota bacterium]